MKAAAKTAPPAVNQHKSTEEVLARLHGQHAGLSGSEAQRGER